MTQVEITTKAAASLMGVDDSHVRLQARTGRLRARKIGRDWLVDAEAAADWHRIRQPRRTKTPKGDV